MILEKQADLISLPEELGSMKAVIVNVRLPDEIISWIDSLVDRKIYNSRSEAIREFSREYVLSQGDKTG